MRAARRRRAAGRRRRCASARTRPPSTRSSRATASRSARSSPSDVDLCIVLGGDGTILTALRQYAGTGVPVFAVNYGEVGFLATVDPDGLGDEFDRAFAGDFETLRLPTITVGRPDGQLDGDQRHLRAPQAGHARRRPGLRRWRARRSAACAATGWSSRPRRARRATTSPTAARSWPGACAGYVVSFIAPHSLTARALVVAPGGPADDQQRVARGARRGPRRRPPGVRAAGGRGHPRRVRARVRGARAAAGGELLPPAARAVRAAGSLRLGPAALAGAEGVAARGCRTALLVGERGRAGGSSGICVAVRDARCRSSCTRTATLPLRTAAVDAPARRPTRAPAHGPATTLRRFRGERRRDGLIRRDPVVDHPMCWKSCVSRTCC